MEQTLLLNATFEPVQVIDWQRAMTLLCCGKVEVVAEHDREVRAVTFSFRLPSVVRLLRFVKIRRRSDYVPFTRANIYARDGHACQYCRAVFADEDLTFDHVVPAAQGGGKTWQNIATCCVECNRRKANRTPAEAGMTLARTPTRPRATPAFRISVGLRSAPKSWHDYIYWNVELEE